MTETTAQGTAAQPKTPDIETPRPESGAKGALFAAAAIFLILGFALFAMLYG